MTRFLVVFGSFSIERGRGQILYFVSVWTDRNYVIYKNNNLVHDLATNLAKNIDFFAF